MRANQERGQIIISRLGMNGFDLQKRLEIIQRSVLQDKEQFVAANPSWKVRNDARITSLNNLFTSLGRTRLGLQFLSELLDDDWFQLHSPDSTRELRIDQAVLSVRSFLWGENQIPAKACRNGRDFACFSQTA